MPLRAVLALFAAILFSACPVLAQDAASESDEDKKDEPKLSTGTLGALSVRSIGPALMSGRVGDIAVNPHDHSEWYVAVASGGVWKTTNAGVTFSPIFDGEGSFSIGCVTIDPRNPSVVWVGTGENNSQRSVAWGDGVYKSMDGGASWKNVGLPESEHIGMIAVDPRDSNVVYVAAQGPLWRNGGERGLNNTTDGGATWAKVLEISDKTGVNEVHLDPRDPDTVYASAYQRQRRVWTLINGGPESGIWKSTDAGATWREITSGLPEVDMGRIGMDISPADPDTLYAIIEAQEDKGGFFRSTDRGETWKKMNDYMTTSPQYYNEIICDPHDVGRVYLLDTFMMVTEDGGKTITRVPYSNRHVDDHALWIDPADPDHLIIGCDGGLYESFDRAARWRFCANLPVTQFYRVAVDNSEPFYFVYGGTQDNNTQGGPSRTTDYAGITNDDWFITVGGDGFEPAVDPEDPSIVYCQWQYGGLVRYDKRSGELTDIRPREREGDEPYVFNWDAPLLISPHSHTRLFFAGRALYRSDDRGNSWTPVSGDLTRGLDRNTLEVMGEVQRPDAVAKHNSTSIYGNIVALHESPLVEGLIYVGTDDGLVQVTEDGGRTWRRQDSQDIDGAPDLSYVSCLRASLHDPDVVYMSLDQHKSGDFAPYLYRSDDRGRTWRPIMGDLPERDVVWAFAEDHVKPGLLFAGTEFGGYFTIDGGAKWVKLPGLPTIAVKDLEIQRRESDLVLATFGRGFYILDDYSPLRAISEDMLQTDDAALFAVKDAPLFVRSNRLSGNDGLGFQGASYFTAPNPPLGAVFTYYIKDKHTTRKEQRHERDKEPGWTYPTVEDSRAEDREQEPRIVLTVRDDRGRVVRRVDGSRDAGLHRASWDLRYPTSLPVRLGDAGEIAPWDTPPVGPLVAPGAYTVELLKEADGVATTLAGPESFNVYALNRATFTAPDPKAAQQFALQVADLQRAVRGASAAAGEIEERLKHVSKAIAQTPGADAAMLGAAESLRLRLADARMVLNGDPTLAGRDEPTPPSVVDRVEAIAGSYWHVTSGPTGTEREGYRIASAAFEGVLNDLRAIDRDLTALEESLDRAGAPWTPGRLPGSPRR